MTKTSDPTKNFWKTNKETKEAQSQNCLASAEHHNNVPQIDNETVTVVYSKSKTDMQPFINDEISI